MRMFAFGAADGTAHARSSLEISVSMRYMTIYMVMSVIWIRSN
jgi:hypothetical protein